MMKQAGHWSLRELWIIKLKAVIKCRICDGSYEFFGTEDRLDRIGCAVCNTFVEGAQAERFRTECLEYASIKNGREVARRKSESLGLRYYPPDEPLELPSGFGVDFYIEFQDS